MTTFKIAPALRAMAAIAAFLPWKVLPFEAAELKPRLQEFLPHPWQVLLLFPALECGAHVHMPRLFPCSKHCLEKVIGLDTQMDTLCFRVCVCVCARARARVSRRVRVGACVRACVRARACASLKFSLDSAYFGDGPEWFP